MYYRNLCLYGLCLVSQIYLVYIVGTYVCICLFFRLTWCTVQELYTSLQKKANSLQRSVALTTMTTNPGSTSEWWVKCCLPGSIALLYSLQWLVVQITLECAVTAAMWCNISPLVFYPLALTVLPNSRLLLWDLILTFFVLRGVTSISGAIFYF